MDYTEAMFIRSCAGVETKQRDDNIYPHHVQYETEEILTPNHVLRPKVAEQVAKISHEIPVS